MMQDPFVFSGTIADNTLRQAGCHHGGGMRKRIAS